MHPTTGDYYAALTRSMGGQVVSRADLTVSGVPCSELTLRVRGVTRRCLTPGHVRGLLYGLGLLTAAQVAEQAARRGR